MSENTTESERIASKNAAGYVKKHNFEEELLDFAKACYYDGFMDGANDSGKDLARAVRVNALVTLKPRVTL